jgi:hypothetical protein
MFHSRKSKDEENYYADGTLAEKDKLKYGE